MAALVLTSYNGQIHTAIDHSDVKPRCRERLGRELRRIPLSLPESQTPIDVLVALLRLKGQIK